MGRFQDDQPIASIDKDILWGPESSVRQELHDIAKAMVEPLVAGAGPADSITFAIYGRWGMGKSSALRMIEAQATSLAEELGQRERLRCCTYRAPAYEAFYRDQKYDVRTTLGLLILRTLAGESHAQMVDFLLDHMGYSFKSIVEERKDRAPDQIAVPKALQQLSQELSLLVDFDKIIGSILHGGNGQGPPVSRPSVLVVFIDDVDRCGGEFVWHLLSTVQQWSGIENLYFVLAMDKEYLRQALREQQRIGEEVDFALEKYVQHSVELPEVDDESLKRYIDRLLPETAPELAAVRANTQLLRYGLHVQTPRSIKRCMNAIAASLRRFVSRTPAPSADEIGRFLKELLLQYSWDGFYRRYFLPAQRDRLEKVHAALVSLESICLTFHGDSDERRLRFELQRIKEQTDIDWVGLPLELAHFLGVPPLFFRKGPRKPGLELFGRPGLEGSNIGTASLAGPAAPELVGPLDQSVLGTQLNQHLFDIQAAAETGNVAVARQAAGAAFELVQEQEAYFRSRPQPAASVLGDAAGALAILGDVEHALPMFRLALSFEGTPRVTVNNLQRLAGMIIGRELTTLYPEAEAAIKRLSEPPLDAISPERTQLLAAGLLMARGEVRGSSPTAWIDELVEQFEQNPTEPMKFYAVMAMATGTKRYDEMRRLARLRYETIDTADDAYVTLRVLADGLGPSDNEADEFEAMELYKFILERVIPVSAKARDARVEVSFNYGTLLYVKDYDDEAGRLFFEAYKAEPQHNKIQAAYSNYLARARRPDLAAKVSRGEMITEMILQPAEKRIPESFLPKETPRWWERSPLLKERKELAAGTER